MIFIVALLSVPLLLSVWADLPCPCHLDSIPEAGGQSSGSVHAQCIDQDLQQVPACVPNNTRLLAFSGNALLLVGPRTLEGLTTLRDLMADHCHVSELSADAFQHTPQLRRLNLGHNSIHDLPAGVFDHTPQLQAVDLSNNVLRSLPAGLFAKVRSLRSLGLSHNHLSTLPGDLLGTCAPQSSLRLDGNLLTGLPVELLHSCASLYSLDLSNNKMTQMSLDVVAAIANLSDLHSLDLEDNPWHCDCSLKPLALMLGCRDLQHHATCGSPQATQNKHVVHQVSALDCLPQTDSCLPPETSAHTDHPHYKNNAAFVALTTVGSVSLLLTASFFIVRHYLKVKSPGFNTITNEEA